uniref:Uncharacterized protein n=1 Tax=Anopheles farauti TaxID=69004 RepID=A0A182QBH6_9DIPT
MTEKAKNCLKTVLCERTSSAAVLRMSGGTSAVLAWFFLGLFGAVFRCSFRRQREWNATFLAGEDYDNARKRNTAKTNVQTSLPSLFVKTRCARAKTGVGLQCAKQSHQEKWVDPFATWHLGLYESLCVVVVKLLFL